MRVHDVWLMMRQLRMTLQTHCQQRTIEPHQDAVGRCSYLQSKMLPFSNVHPAACAHTLG